MLWTTVAGTAKGRGKTGTGRRRMAALLALNSGFKLGLPALTSALPALASTAVRRADAGSGK